MILEINGRRVEVADTFRNLSPEQQQATVEEIAGSMGSMPAPAPMPTAEPAPSQDQGAMSWLNRGIASGLDAIAGTANRGANAGRAGT